jgi:acetyltransferase-like isoleucine patch superfamily enzyme
MIGDFFPLDKVCVGRGTYGPIHAISYGGADEGLEIGDFCSIADNVTFLLGGGHSMSCLSTYPFRAKYLNAGESQTKGRIVLDDDVWIGFGATIMPGVHLARGCVVGAGALVTKDVPAYAVVGGVPARVIKYRFEKDVVARLMAIDFDKIDREFVAREIDLLESPIDQETLGVLEAKLACVK